MGKDGQEEVVSFCVVIRTCYFTRNEYLIDKACLHECNSSKYKDRRELSHTDKESWLFYPLPIFSAK